MKNYKLSPEAVVMVSGSSAGTQPKYYDNGYWYKTDQAGYESTAEYLISRVLSFSNVREYVSYEPCMVNGRKGCRAENFLKPDEAFISFQRLYDIYEGGNLSERILPMQEVKARVEFVIGFVAEFGGVDCREYLSDILTLDMITLNTDRHFHNLGIIVNHKTGAGRPAPVFDNGDALLSSFTKFDPLTSVEEHIAMAYAQPFSSNHEVQAKEAGFHLQIRLEQLMNALDKEEPSRALDVLKRQLQRYEAVIAAPGA